MHRKASLFHSTFTFATQHGTPTPPRPVGDLSTRPPVRRHALRRYSTPAAASVPSPDPSSPTPTPSDAADDLPPWPSVPASTTPTPYQILATHPNTPYNKARFVELVKLYHPDRNPFPHAHLNPSGCGRALGLERYRLIVAAHTLLSDAAAREAYDRHGLGWAAAAGPRARWSTTHRWRGDAAGADVRDDPMYCATWEDWEAWRARRDGHADPGYFTAGSHSRQTPLFASNYTFLALVALLAALGGIGQATRAHAGAQSRLERARQVSEENGRVLMRARQDALDWEKQGEGKRERIKRFLRERGDYDEGEFDGRSDTRGSLCAGSTDEGFWRRPPER